MRPEQDQNPDLIPNRTPGGKASAFAALVIQGLQTQRYQLILTVLTMAVGSWALALTLFVGQGAVRSLWTDLEKLMGGWVTAYYDAGPSGGLLQQRPFADFTEEDFQNAADRLKGLARLTAPVYHWSHPVRTKTKSLELPVDGVTPEVEQEPLYQPISGSALSHEAHQALTRECLATQSAARVLDLDPSQRPGIFVGGHWFTVVGIAPDPPRVPDRFRARIVVPYQCARLLWLKPNAVGHILAAWEKPEDMEQVTRTLSQALDLSRGPGTYYLSSSLFQIRKMKNIVHKFLVVGAAQGFFCILAASIGVLNVMLAGVTRRTHEFAVRTAMGASRRELIAAVLTESLALGLLGAGLGAVGAVISAPWAADFLGGFVLGSDAVQPYFGSLGLLSPFLVCGLCALAAGLVPAFQAGRIDILAALRRGGH